MHQSRWISQFTVGHKATPTTTATNAKDPENSHFKQEPCRFCAQHLASATELRKKEILLQLQIEQLKETVDRLGRENRELKEHKISSYQEYQRRLESENHQYWSRQDIEAELFEAKVIIQLLLVSKAAHPKISNLNDEALKQKYSDLLLQNWRLQEKVEARERLIKEKQFYPLYHQDKRISTLQKAVQYWYKKSNEDCCRMKRMVQQMRVRLDDEKLELREQVRGEMDSWRHEFMSKMEMLGSLTDSDCKKGHQLPKKKNNASSLVSSNGNKKSVTAPKQSELRKLR